MEDEMDIDEYDKQVKALEGAQDGAQGRATRDGESGQREGEGLEGERAAVGMGGSPVQSAILAEGEEVDYDGIAAGELGLQPEEVRERVHEAMEALAKGAPVREVAQNQVQVSVRVDVEHWVVDLLVGSMGIHMDVAQARGLALQLRQGANLLEREAMRRKR
jgi:hypothetical protein